MRSPFSRVPSLFLIAAAACGNSSGGAAPTTGDAGTVIPPPTIPPEPPLDGGSQDAAGPDVDAATIPDAAPSGPSIKNPLERDFSDPATIFDGKTFHLYSTDSRGHRVPHVTSPDLANWDLAGENDAMPAPSPWAENEFMWAPGVLPVSTSRYVLFFATKVKGSAPAQSTGHMCIGRAVASSPSGPFVDTSTVPLVCPTGGLWAIDPSPFRGDGGKLYLVWRNDKHDSTPGWSAMNTVMVRELAPDGADFAPGSHETQLIERTDGSWEGAIIENPSMGQVGGKWFLFYSANAWATARYAIGYASCKGPTGPCTKESVNGPWFGSQAQTSLRGPGGEDFIRGIGGAPVVYDGTEWLQMHGWVDPKVGYAAGGMRAYWLGRISLSGGAPLLVLP